MDLFYNGIGINYFANYTGMVMSKSLSERLEAFRTDRPSEWMMDEFMRDAQALEAQLKEREWIRLSKSCPKTDRSYDIWVKSSEREDYGRRLADVMFYDGHFHTKHHGQPVTHPEYISHYAALPLYSSEPAYDQGQLITIKVVLAQHLSWL